MRAKCFLAFFAMLLLAGCSYETVEREVGFKGKARINPWLAAQRFAVEWGMEVKPQIGWVAPQWDDAICMMPASVLNNKSFTGRMTSWVADGGHLLLLVERADAVTNDWNGRYQPSILEDALHGMLDEMGLELVEENAVSGDEVELDGDIHEVNAESGVSVAVQGGEGGVFATARYGDGRVSVVTDGRIFRSRWIDEEEHADLFAALLDITEYEGALVIVRGAGVSFWTLLKRHAWPVLVALAVLLILWLWMSFSRFGPLETSAAQEGMLDYEKHLEALGDFHWRLDKGAALLAPARERIVELGQRTSEASGHRDDDLFQFLADRSGLDRERVFRALAETRPADSGILTRTTADLQQLLSVLHNPSKP